MTGLDKIKQNILDEAAEAAKAPCVGRNLPARALGRSKPVPKPALRMWLLRPVPRRDTFLSAP